MHLSGMSPFIFKEHINFINVGERCNISGSAKFKKLIKEDKYDTAVSIAKDQVENGAQIETFTPVIGIRTEAGRVRGVETPRGEVKCSLLVNATASWAPELASLADVKLPNRPERHEILVTEYRVGTSLERSTNFVCEICITFAL